MVIWSYMVKEIDIKSNKLLKNVGHFIKEFYYVSRTEFTFYIKKMGYDFVLITCRNPHVTGTSL